MADKQDKGGTRGFSFGGFNQLGATLRQSAQEISAKAAAQVNDITKLTSHISDGTDSVRSNTESNNVANEAIGNSTESVTVPQSGLKSDSLEKKELIEMMQKMNKKMKLLSTIRQQLTDKVEQLEKEKDQLKSLVVDEILNGGVSVEENQDEVSQIRLAWRRMDEQNSMALQQLQNEFKKLHAERQTNGNNNNDSNTWEKEKQEILTKYEQDIKLLKDELSQKKEELTNLTSSSNSQDERHAAELQKIREESRTQLQAFQQKVATARSNELNKVKAEMKEQAQDMLEKKVLELKQQYELQIEDIKNQREQAFTESSNERYAALQQLHTSAMDKLRSEMLESKGQEIALACKDASDKATSQMELALKTTVDQLTKEHNEELEKFRKESSEKLNALSSNAAAQVQSISEKAKNKISELQTEINSSKQSYENTIKDLRAELESTKNAAKAEMEEELEKVRKSNAAAQSGKIESDLASLRESLNNAAKLEKENLMKQFAQEKENLRTDFMKKYQAAIQKIQADANVLKDDAVKKVRDEMSGRFEEMKKQLETQKELEIRAVEEKSNISMKTLMQENEARAKSMIEESQKEFNAKIENLSLHLEQKTKDLQSKTSVEQSLLSKVEELQSILASIRDGNENSSQAMDEALSKQRISFEEQLQTQKQQHSDQLQKLMLDCKELEKVKDTSQVESNTLRENVKRLTDDMDAKVRELGESFDELKALKEEIQRITNERDHSIQALEGMNEKYNVLVSQLSQMKDEDEKSKQTISSYTSSLELLKQQLADTNQKWMQELSDKEKLHNEAVESFSKQISDKEAEISKISSSGDQANEAYTSLQSQLSDLQLKYDHDTNGLRNEIEALQTTLNTTKETYERQISDLKASYQSNSSSSESAMAEAIQKVISEKDAEIASITASYEAKIQESVKKERAVAQTFNKVKTAYAQKIKTVETELTDKLNLVSAEKSELQKALEDTKSHLETLTKNHESEVNELRASFGKKIEQLVSEYDALLKEENEKVVTAEDSSKNLEVVVAKLQAELQEVRQEAITAKASTGEAIENELKERMKVIEENHSKSMENTIAEFESQLKVLTEENANLKVKAEFADTLELQKVELTNKLELQARKNEEDTTKLRKTMETHVDKMTAQFKEKLEQARKVADADIAAMQKLNQEKEQKLSTLVDRLKALTSSSTKLRDENESLKKKVESEAQVQKELRSKLEALKKQFDESSANSSATVSSLLQEQEKLQYDKVQLTNQMKSLQGTIQSQSNKIEELSGKLSALTSNLNALTEERKEQEDKLERALKLEPKLKASEAEATDLRDQINKLKLERQKNITLVERLQAEKETNERNHSQRTALVGMLESQLSQLNEKNAEVNAKFEAALYDLSQKDELIQSNEDTIRKLEQELEEAQTNAKKTSEALSAAQKNAESKSTKMVESLQRELQATKQQMVRKSSAAQRLIQQRETECAELRAANRALQQEVDKGSYSERRIFELAANQSNRESLQLSEIEARDSIIEKLKSALLERDGDLANAEKQAREVESKLEDLFRIRRREDVNIDYLKSIVVKYLSLPPGSDERARLLPVLATLLQFDDYDYKVIEDGKTKVSWWGSSVIPTLISAPSTSSVAPAYGSAEVSVSQATLRTQGSSDSTGKQTRSTSLQF